MHVSFRKDKERQGHQRTDKFWRKWWSSRRLQGKLPDSKGEIVFEKVHETQYAWEACLCLKRNSGGGVERMGWGRN